MREDERTEMMGSLPFSPTEMVVRSMETERSRPRVPAGTGIETSTSERVCFQLYGSSACAAFSSGVSSSVVILGGALCMGGIVGSGAELVMWWWLRMSVVVGWIWLEMSGSGSAHHQHHPTSLISTTNNAHPSPIFGVLSETTQPSS